MIVAGIVGAEVAFWVVLGLALATRYLLRRRRASTVLLWALPLVDLALLGFVVADLASGAEPTQSHALAASYLGFTVAFGRPLVRWADARFAHRFAGGPPVVKPAKGSAAYVRGLWVEWFRVVFAAGIAVVVLAFLALVVRQEPIPASLDQAGPNPLWSQMLTLGIVVTVWFLAGPAFTRRTVHAS
ncbi:hypothetical protein EIL87_12005 [Saccharopolyspora rhizosphaerae]|uniref:Uncharacterized protein n=1 Tax=Saccharopolyspora rhizosphaerae TaxID=2492662 RepID=A0A3R8P5K0_9PSEU|nr:hypothetical protein [Saccharopolyspora rhizosphaerae]RRO16996.1 hypothetical protein EIL87_12005 [Saccharopolyspora rhizosphaerae]